jgi:cytochrome c553
MKNLMFALVCGALSINAFAGNIANGEALAKKNNCFTCHGADYKSPIDPSYPKLAGQHAKYLSHALVAYQRGDGPNGRSNAIMVGQVKSLKKSDIDDIAAYLHSLPGDLVLKR